MNPFLAIGNRYPRAFFFAAVCIAASLGCTACRKDLMDQPRMNPFRPSSVFADGTSARPLLPGTLAQEESNTGEAFNTGARAGQYLTQLPVALTRPLLERGRERFDIYCAVCHGETGSGDGIIPHRGFPAPPTYHSPRVRAMPVGYLFAVITNGYGAMYSYASRIPAADRWAIVAYIRALQFSQDAPIAQLDPATRAQLERPAS